MGGIVTTGVGETGSVGVNGGGGSCGTGGTGPSGGRCTCIIGGAKSGIDAVGSTFTGGAESKGVRGFRSLGGAEGSLCTTEVTDGFVASFSVFVLFDIGRKCAKGSTGAVGSTCTAKRTGFEGAMGVANEIGKAETTGIGDL